MATEITQIKLHENLICPITLDIFKEPVFIPECGHTFDRLGLINSVNKKCPICTDNFTGNPIDFKINWSIASILDINIKKSEIKPVDNIITYDAAKAKSDRHQYINGLLDKLMLHTLSNIRQLALSGKNSFEINISSIDNTIMEAFKMNILKKGFTFNQYSGCIRVSW